MYKTKLTVCSEIHTEHLNAINQHVNFLNVKSWWYVK